MSNIVPEIMEHKSSAFNAFILHKLLPQGYVKKQVSWTDAGQKFVHPIRKGDIKKKLQ